MDDRCPHRGVQLSGGSLDGDTIVCPFHGFAFNTSGHCTQIPVQPAETTIPRALCVHAYPACELQGYVFMWWGAVPEKLPAIDWFTEELAGLDGPYEQWADCNTGLSRNIENQLDSAHLPFVHARSIGRLVKSRVSRVECEVKENHIRLYQHGRRDYYVEMRLPNLWINRIGPKAWVTLAFVPITTGRTRLYTRYYQGFLRIPLLKQLLGWVMGKANLWILREDIRVVETHDTAVSPALDGSELLQPCDIAVIEYRRLRKGWQHAAKDDSPAA